MTNENGTKSHRARKVKISHIVLGLIVVLLALMLTFKLSMKSKLESRLNAIRAAGYPVTPTELNQWCSIPDGAQNAADSIIEAFSHYDTWDDEQTAQVPVVGAAELAAPGEPISQETKDLIASYLAENKKALELLYLGAAIQHSRYPVDFTEGFDALFPELGDIRQAVRLLQLQAVLHAEKDEPAGALDSIEAMLGVAGTLDQEPLLISQLVRISFNRLAVSTVEQVLNRTEFSDKQLIDMAQPFRAAENSDGFMRGLVGERCIGSDMLRNLNFGKSPDSQRSPVPRPIIGLYKASGLADIQTVRYLDYMTGYIEAVQLPPRQRQVAAEANKAKLQDISRIHIFLRLLAPALSRTVILDVKHLAAMQSTRVALAVQRYRLAHNKLPSALTDLVPIYLDAVPQDPFDGNDLRYKIQDSGFVVYSIDEDGVDDGGTKEPPRDEREDDASYDLTFTVYR